MMGMNLGLGFSYRK